MVSYIISGRHNPSLDVTFRLEHLFGIPASQLLGAQEGQPKSA